MDLIDQERSAAWRSPLSHWQAGSSSFVTQLERQLIEYASDIETIFVVLGALEKDPDCLEELGNAYSIKKAIEQTLLKMAGHRRQVVILMDWMQARPRAFASLPCGQKIMNRISLTLRENSEMARYSSKLDSLRAHL